MTVVLDYQVGASGDDGSWCPGPNSFASNSTEVVFGCSTSRLNDFFRFTGVTIPVGATITTSYLSFYYKGKSGTPPACSLYFEDAANPAAPTTYADANGRVKTTQYISVTCPGSGTWWNTSSINTIIQELVNSYDYSAGASMQVLEFGGGTGTNYGSVYTYDYSGNARGAKLHIEYTEPVSIVPGLMSQYRRRR